MTTQYKQLISQAVQKYGLPPEYADIGYRQMLQESGGKADAVSPKGAQGLMQFMPKTAQAYGLQNPNDPSASIDAWGRMMADLHKQTGGNPAHVLAAYNWGIGNLNKQGLQNAPAETRNYIQKILGGMPPGGVQVAKASNTYMPPRKPAVDGLGGGDYHAAVAEHSTPGIPPVHDALAAPEFDQEVYRPGTEMAAYGPAGLAAFGPDAGLEGMA
jgi:hypothetical protein